LAAILTGVIPPRRHGVFRHLSPDLFLPGGLFSPFSHPGAPGTFVPIADCFSNPRVAAMETEFEKQGIVSC
jgi:hypothetical protein